MSNLQEYLAGTIAFDLNDGFSLKMVEVNADGIAMEFMAIRGRTYTVFGSSNLKDWGLVPFHLSGDEASLPDRQSYQALETGVVQVSVSPSSGQDGPRLFKLRVE